MLKIITLPAHPIARILFNTETREKFFKIFGDDIHLFYAPYISEKYSKQENLFFDGHDLSGNHIKQLLQPNEIRDALEQKKLCPAPIIVFAILSFINHTKCLGSFAQIEYLPRFQTQWQEMGFNDTSSIVPTQNLTTVMFPKNPKTEVLDLLLNHAKIPGNANDLLGEYLLPIWEIDRVYSSKQGQKK